MTSLSLVTGGAGFIGSHMVDCLLAQGHKVRVVDNLRGGHERNLSHLQGNPDLICEWKDICELRPSDNLFKDVDYVFHFAGIGDIVPSIQQPIDYMEVNINGTVRVLECARFAGVKKVIYAASSSCYGKAKIPTKESHPINTLYPYALSKYLGECAALHWQQVYRLPVNSIRIFNAYGPRVRTTGAYGAVFGVFFRQKLANQPFTVVGDGSQSRDFIYVTDITKAFYSAAISHYENKIWNLGAGNPQTINYLVEIIGGEKEFIPKRPGEPDCTFADIKEIKNDLGWRPTVTFEQGVKSMMADIHYWSDAPLWDKETIAQATKTWFEYL